MSMALEHVLVLAQVRVSKWLKELEKMFYGACEAYEKVLTGSHAGVDLCVLKCVNMSALTPRHDAPGAQGRGGHDRCVAEECLW